MTQREQLQVRVGINRANDLALLAAGDETGWWDHNGVPAPWPDDFFDPDNGWQPAGLPTDTATHQNGGTQPPF